MIRCATLPLILVACTVTACQSGGGAPIVFAPQLGVDLSQMTAADGVHYRDLAVGDGAQVRNGGRVRVYYVGWLSDGTPFDSTRPPEAPIEFVVGEGRVIRGWERGITGMRVGGRRQLVVPPSMGYGNRGVASVPPRSTLVFTIEVVDAR